MTVDQMKLKTIMAKQKVTVKGLADLSGVSKMSLNSILKGKTKTTRIDIVGRIADALQCSPSDFAE